MCFRTQIYSSLPFPYNCFLNEGLYQRRYDTRASVSKYCLVSKLAIIASRHACRTFSGPVYSSTHNLPAGVGAPKLGVAAPMEGVPKEGVFPILGVPPPILWEAGVSSQRERRLLNGVGVSDTLSPPPPRSVRGVSAHPARLGVSPEWTNKKSKIKTINIIIMPRCACASEVYGSVFVCLSVCVDCYSCSRINEVQVRVSIGF